MAIGGYRGEKRGASANKPAAFSFNKLEHKHKNTPPRQPSALGLRRGIRGSLGAICNMRTGEG
eukprot:scaffold5197_cov117-Isochrysis_galbana.AAC.2